MSGVLVVHRGWSRAGTTALFLGNGVLAGTWAANIPRIQLAHGLSDTALGSLLLAFGIGAITAMSLTGALAARVGAGRVASVSGVLLALLFPLFAVVSGWQLLLALSAVVGAVGGTMDVAMNAYASELEQRRGGALMSSFHAGWSIGGLVGAAISGALAGFGWGLGETLAAGSCVIAAGGLAGFGLPALDGPARPRAAFRLPSRALAGVCLMTGLGFLAEGVIADWSGVYLSTVIGTNAAWATTGYTAFAVAMVVGRLTGDAVVARLGPVRVVWVGGVVAALGLGVALTTANRWAVDGGLVVVGAGLANVVPAVFSAAGRMAGTGGVAMASATGFASLLVGPPLIGSAADAIGLRPAMALMLLAAIALLMLLARSLDVRRDGPR